MRHTVVVVPDEADGAFVAHVPAITNRLTPGDPHEHDSCREPSRSSRLICQGVVTTAQFARLRRTSSPRRASLCGFKIA